MPAEYRPSVVDRPKSSDMPQQIEAKKGWAAERAKLRSEWHRVSGWFPRQARHPGAADLRKARGIEVAQV